MKINPRLIEAFDVMGTLGALALSYGELLSCSTKVDAFLAGFLGAAAIQMLLLFRVESKVASYACAGFGIIGPMIAMIPYTEPAMQAAFLLVYGMNMLTLLKSR